MSKKPALKDVKSLPRESEWYAQEPFNPKLVAFTDERGVKHRYMNTPLDEAYLTDPGDSYEPGTIPPEEREVRDMIFVTVLFRNRVSKLAVWWSHTFKPTQSYLKSLECFYKLQMLCSKSKEHRAAFCRLTKSENLSPDLRLELMRIMTFSS